MRNKKWYQSPEMIVAFSALLVSLVTAGIGVYSASIDRAYARASVWPRLEIFRSFGLNNFSYGVTNNGTGPALIKFARVAHDSTYIKYWRDIPGLPNFTQSHIGGRIIASQNSVNPISFSGGNNDSLQAMDQVTNIELCYCSIYDECWLIDRANKPEPIAECQIDEKERFLQ